MFLNMTVKNVLIKVCFAQGLISSFLKMCKSFISSFEMNF